MSEMHYDLIIVGAGPAGMGAAIYSARANTKIAMIEKDTPGGKMVRTSEIENYLGIKSINGADLSLQMFDHATQFGAEYVYGNVIDIIDEGKIKKVVCEDNTYSAYAVILATGTKERKVGISGEDEFYGKGVSYCAICDGALYKGLNMAVLGEGETAVEEAIYLSKFAREVTLVNSRGVFRASKELLQQLSEINHIKVLLNTTPLAIEGNQHVESLRVRDNQSGVEQTLDVPIVFPFMGLVPESRFSTRLGITDANGYIQVSDTMQTRIEGIYAAGDVINKSLRQIVTASSDGAIAAIQALRHVEKMKRL